MKIPKDSWLETRAHDNLGRAGMKLLASLLSVAFLGSACQGSRQGNRGETASKDSRGPTAPVAWSKVSEGLSPLHAKELPLLERVVCNPRSPCWTTRVYSDGQRYSLTTARMGDGRGADGQEDSAPKANAQKPSWHPQGRVSPDGVKALEELYASLCGKREEPKGNAQGSDIHRVNVPGCTTELVVLGSPEGELKPISKATEILNNPRWSQATVKDGAPPSPPAPGPRRVSPASSVSQTPARLRTGCHLLGVDPTKGHAYLSMSNDPDNYLGGAPSSFAVMDTQTGREVASHYLGKLSSFLVGFRPEGLGRPGQGPRATPDLTHESLRKSVQTILPYHSLRFFPKMGERRLAISPDGRQVLINAGDRIHHSTDGGETYKAIPPGVAYRPLIAKTGMIGAFSGYHQGKYHLYLMELERPGVAPRRIPGTLDLGDMAFGPDGKQIFAVMPKGPAKGESRVGCLYQLGTRPPHQRRELACVPYRASYQGPSLAVSPKGLTALIHGQSGAPGSAEVPYALIDLSSGKVLQKGTLKTSDPLFVTVSDLGRAAWVGDFGRVTMADLEAGTTSELPGTGRAVQLVSFIGPETLVLAGCETSSPWVMRSKVEPGRDPAAKDGAP
ncbi:MAG: hypothetical protein RBU30_18450 [Polyangia bacterium]|jgi:hypothetical protein|nr:hypothetical protein [Polyangia bacterium]